MHTVCLVIVFYTRTNQKQNLKVIKKENKHFEYISDWTVGVWPKGKNLTNVYNIELNKDQMKEIEEYEDI